MKSGNARSTSACRAATKNVPSTGNACGRLPSTSPASTNRSARSNSNASGCPAFTTSSTRRWRNAANSEAAGRARKSVLEDLESRQEGLGIGVKDILSRARTARTPPWNQMLGSVAELLEVDLEQAALAETALDAAPRPS